MPSLLLLSEATYDIDDNNYQHERRPPSSTFFIVDEHKEDDISINGNNDIVKVTEEQEGAQVISKGLTVFSPTLKTITKSNTLTMSSSFSRMMMMTDRPTSDGNTRMVENETLQDARGNKGVYNGPVWVEESGNDNIPFIGPHPSDDPDAPPPPLTEISLDDDKPPVPHGKYGQMVYIDNDEFLKYTGDWEYGRWTKGTCLYTNGNLYSGPWNKEGQPHGPDGKLEWVVMEAGNPAVAAAAATTAGEDTRIYQGDWYNGMRHGKGTYTWARTGAVYQGGFDSNQRQGHGSYRDPTSQIEYAGEWQGGVYHGYGQYTWIDSKLHEKCVYRGNFVKGKPHGQGIQVDSNGQVMHEGTWENGKPVKIHKNNINKDATPQKKQPRSPARTPAAAATRAAHKPQHQQPSRGPPTGIMDTPRAPPNSTPAAGPVRRAPGPPVTTPKQQLHQHQHCPIPAPGMAATPPRPVARNQASASTTPTTGRTPATTNRTPVVSFEGPLPGGGAVTVVHDREWMDAINHAHPTLGIYRGLWLHQNPYQNGVVEYKSGEVVSYEGWFNSQGYFHGQGCRMLFRNGDTYEGDFQFGQRDGKGLYCWKDGRQYKGDFSKNARQGKGTLIYPNSDFYEGHFVQGKRQGYGRFIFASGSMYEGAWLAGQYHGQGTLVQADGCTYVGEFYMGAKHGKGKDMNHLGVVTYEGMYYKGKKSDGSQEQQQLRQQHAGVSGSAELVESYWVEDDDGSGPAPLTGQSSSVNVQEEPPCEAVVDQEIQDCQGNMGRFTGIVLCSTKRPHGVGRLVYADGKRIHEGFWKNGSKEGHGRCLFFPQGDFHEGEYQNNLRNGPGRYQWKDGRLFIGEYKDDMRHGRGVFTYPSGDKYSGMFFRGQRSGFGKFVFSGGQYEGEWRGGKYHGHGRLVWGRGTEYEGEFAHGTFHGMGTLRDYAGNILEQGRWYQGKRVLSHAPLAPPPAMSPPTPPQATVSSETPAIVVKRAAQTPQARDAPTAVNPSAKVEEGEESDVPATLVSPPVHEDNDDDNPVTDAAPRPGKNVNIEMATTTTTTSPSDQVGGENPAEKKKRLGESKIADEDAAPQPLEPYVVESGDDYDNDGYDKQQDAMKDEGLCPVTAIEL